MMCVIPNLLKNSLKIGTKLSLERYPKVQKLKGTHVYLIYPK